MTTVFAAVNIPIVVDDCLVKEIRSLENANSHEAWCKWRKACESLDKVIIQEILKNPPVIERDATILRVSEVDEDGDFDLLYEL